MANRANLRIWTRDFSEATMIPEFARFLTTAPLSASQTAFTELHVQPVDSTETAVAQWDLRDQSYGPPEVARLAAQHLDAGTAYILGAKLDILLFDMGTMKWRQGPQPLTLTLHGPLLDDRIA